MKKLLVLLFVAVVAVVALGEDAGVSPTVFDQTGPVAFWDADGQIILGVRRTEVGELIVEIGDSSKIVAIYDEDGVDLLQKAQGPLIGWAWIAIAWAFFIGLAIGGV